MRESLARLAINSMRHANAIAGQLSPSLPWTNPVHPARRRRRRQRRATDALASTAWRLDVPIGIISIGTNVFTVCQAVA